MSLQLDSEAGPSHVPHSSPYLDIQSSFNSDIVASPIPSPIPRSSPLQERQSSSCDPNPSVSTNPQLDIVSSKNGINQCVRYPNRKDFETESEFVQRKDNFMLWWKTTVSAARFEKTGKEMQWGGAKRSPGWQHFIEVAQLKDGKPQACCIHCKMLVNHPGSGNGTKTLNLHPQSQQCGYQGTPKQQNASIKNYTSGGPVSFYFCNINGLLILFVIYHRQIYQICPIPVKHFRSKLFISLLETDSLSDWLRILSSDNSYV